MVLTFLNVAALVPQSPPFSFFASLFLNFLRMNLPDPTKTQNAQQCMSGEVDTAETKDGMNKLLVN